jgi:hypothetical protein
MLQPEGMELPLEISTSGIAVSIPVLKHHAMVVLDLNSTTSGE